MPRTANYPIKKVLTFTAEQWAQVRDWRFSRKVDSESEAVRRLLARGLMEDPPAVRSVTRDEADRA